MKVLSFVSALIILFTILLRCTPPAKEEGKILSATYCGSCHRVPDPSELDKSTWLLGVLPEMGARLGMKSFGEIKYTHANEDSSFYPSHAAITSEEWGKIVNYYYTKAPDSLTRRYDPIPVDLKLFEVSAPPRTSTLPPTTTYLKIDPGNHKIFEAQGVELKLTTYDRQLRKIDEVNTPQVVVDIAFQDLNRPGPREAMMLNMGELRPTDVTHGSIQALSIDKGEHLKLSAHPIKDQLPRPVNIQPADIDHDGLMDYVVCGYGNLTGELFWLKNTGDTFEKVTIRNQPGSIQAIVKDFNEDGLPDILALFAQGDEGIWLFEQKADHSFTDKLLLRFSPAAGSISIDLADFNNDGAPDIVYTSGDNADYSKILKPYHGVYVYMNDGHWNFKQEYFFRINGCFDAVARDFDLDGDLDIAAIAYFGDYDRRPEEGFVYLENKGEMKFSPHSIPQHSMGRWITLDAADLDGDGDLDIVLGNLSIGPSNMKTAREWRSGPTFFYLDNKTR